jgi:hypothetical protein
MDVFSRTFLPTATATRMAARSTGRHMPVLRQCVEPDDSTVLMTRCTRPDQPMAGEFLLLLTRRRLVVTQRSRMLHRLRLHLNTNLSHLSNVTWSADERQSALEVGVTAIDGVRERFVIKLAGMEQVWQVEALFKTVFHDRATRRLKAAHALAA